jgi:serine/threonine protein kinase
MGHAVHDLPVPEHQQQIYQVQAAMPASFCTRCDADHASQALSFFGGRPKKSALTGTRGHAGEWRGLPVAIKTVVFQSTASDDQLALIASEAAISSSLSHRNIVTTYSHDIRNITTDSGFEVGLFKFHLIQEYCSGGSLRDAIDSGLFRRMPSRWQAISTVLLDVAAGMAYMHANRICHSDLNPANVLLKVCNNPNKLAISIFVTLNNGAQDISD